MIIYEYNHFRNLEIFQQQKIYNLKFTISDN
jgi:hypothetical protein